ncbi:MAG TPA: hypothetical protein DD640_00340 [Clostridiales bacterium]|nr:hypothetical protein [Clostridiales bacterium]
MYSLNNGILHQDGKPVLALGLSYYASYHPQKVPVLADGDREGQMDLDLREMAEAGFNILRFAALGNFRRVGEGAAGIEAEFPLIDRGVSAAHEVNMAAMVRLQGYTLNVSGYTGEAMVTPEGRELGLYECFLRASLNHEGILRDNEDCTAASARHFSGFPSVVSHQIYNEPAYHFGVDYNPHSIAAYRRWLVSEGIKDESAAQATDPPRKRPEAGADPSEWITWRLFHYQRLNWYMGHLAGIARRNNPAAETLTCLMNCPLSPGAVMFGEDYYRTAQDMEILGITHYTPACGESQWNASETLDAAESAAASFGKHAWLIEYNARTDMPASEWDRETYSAVGSGIKGILYYQWRADFPFADGPEPNQFGILYNDRTRTAAYASAVAMNRLINDKLSSRIALAEKCRAGVAVLFSEKANAYYDAVDHGQSRTAHNMMHAYRLFRKAGVPVDFTRACDLAANPLGVRLLIVPARGGLSRQEIGQILDFQNKGAQVVEFNAENNGFYQFCETPVQRKHGYIYDDNSAEEILDIAGIRPMILIEGSRQVDGKLIAGQGYHIVCLVNTDIRERIQAAGTVALSLDIGTPAAAVHRITFLTPSAEIGLSACDRDGRLQITLPELRLGAFLVIEHDLEPARGRTPC